MLTIAEWDDKEREIWGDGDFKHYPPYLFVKEKRLFDFSEDLEVSCHPINNAKVPKVRALRFYLNHSKSFIENVENVKCIE